MTILRSDQISWVLQTGHIFFSVLVNFSYVGRKLLKRRKPVLYFALSFHVTVCCEKPALIVGNANKHLIIMNTYFGTSCKCLHYKAFYRYSLIPRLDSQHPAPGPGTAMNFVDLYPCWQTLSTSTSDTQRDDGPKSSQRRNAALLMNFQHIMHGFQQPSKDGSCLFILKFQGGKSP